MKHKIQLAFFSFILAFVAQSCSKDSYNDYTEVSFSKVKGLSLYGDSCYLKGDNSIDTDYIINTQEEFDLLFDCPGSFTPSINFETHTLLAGSRYIRCIYPKNAFEKVYLNESKKELIYNALFNYDGGCSTSFGTIYYHVLISKHQSDLYNFKADVEIDYNYN
ncbi:MAG: hypothetical protein CL663_00665 [Bacteroidetes bacterium]|nr:hypothetical protein [Bacteroidota bacterium]